MKITRGKSYRLSDIVRQAIPKVTPRLARNDEGAVDAQVIDATSPRVQRQLTNAARNMYYQAPPGQIWECPCHGERYIDRRWYRNVHCFADARLTLVRLLLPAATLVADPGAARKSAQRKSHEPLRPNSNRKETS